MCGIVGYVGPRPAAPILLDGLKKLEYRGYDSAGLAVHGASGVERRAQRRQARQSLAGARAETSSSAPSASVTRAGRRTGARASRTRTRIVAGDIAVVHNGIIENHIELRKQLDGAGRPLRERNRHARSSPISSHRARAKTTDAVRRRARGAFRAARRLRARRRQRSRPRIASSWPRAPRRSSSASGTARRCAAATSPRCSVTRAPCSSSKTARSPSSRRAARASKRCRATRVERAPRRIDWSPMQAERGGYKHFMLKEIFEQPRALEDTLRGRIRLDGGRR